MILNRITTLLEHLARHAAFNSHCHEKLCDKVNHMARSMGEPNGRVTFGGCVELNPREARRAVEGLGHHVEAEAVRMDYEFSQNLYLTIDPKMNAQIKEALDRAPLEQLEKKFESYRKLNELIVEAEAQSKAMLEYAEKAKEAFQVDVRQLIEGETKAQKQRLAAEYDKAREERKKIDAALLRLEKGLKKVDALKAEAGNIIKASKPASRGIVSIKS